MPGHVFIVHGDLRRLASDAWLLPTDASLRIEESWRGWPPGDASGANAHAIDAGAPTDSWRAGKERVKKLEGWNDAWPEPWLVNVSARPTAEVAWYVEGAKLFVDAVAAHLRSAGRASSRHGRKKPLVALPVVGTRFGGAEHATGDVVRALLPMLDEATRRHDLDVALVAINEPTFTAAEAERRARWSAGAMKPELSSEQRACADALARHADANKLVLFLGAGVSAGAGLPLWGALLRRMAERAGLTEDEREQLSRFDAMDQASILQSRLAARGSDVRAFRDEVVSLARASHASLSHMLLAGLPVSEIVTTNYDDLFEIASSGIGRHVSVLPHAPESDAGRWLLKLHGCVSQPDDIVLTREDFLRYEHRRAALAGIVQALLITKHMLFVGFSLDDANFHRIADAVRRAHGRKARAAKAGTVLRIESDPLLETLWKDDLDFLFAGDARHLEIFLDYLLATTRAPLAHVLDPRYRATQSAGERVLGEHLARFLDGLPAEAKSGEAWDEVASLVARLGGATQ